jgi:hypothetical protein
MENIMVERITENWWKLSFEDDGGKAVFFGYTEGEVKGKFESWFRRVKRKL